MTTSIPLDYDNDVYLVKWKKKISKGAFKTYRRGFELFIEFAKMTPKQLVDEKDVDMRKRALERTERPEFRVLEFLEWLEEKYTKDEGFSKNGNNVLSENARITYTSAVRSFYKKNGVALDMASVAPVGTFVPVAKLENETVKLTAKQVEKLAHYAPTLRDKALIWVGFQSGLDASVILALNWEHVAEELVNPPLTKVEVNGVVKEYPSVILRRMWREKRKGQFKTFLGKSAIDALTRYLVERFGEDFAEKMDAKEPLFVAKYGVTAGGRLDYEAFRIMMKDTAFKADIANGRLKRADKNPLGASALRASFQAKLKQIAEHPSDKENINFMVGHKARYGKAYDDFEDETLRKFYCKCAIQILEPKAISPEVESKLQDVESLKKMFAEEKLRTDKLYKALELMLSEIRTFQRETLKRLGDSDEVVEETMKLSGSKLEDYLKTAENA